MTTSFHGPGRGSANAEERWLKAAFALAECRQRNREHACAILVEGRRDREALERLGFSGPIEVLNRGWRVDDVLVYMVETYGRRNPTDGGSTLVYSWIGTEQEGVCRVHAAEIWNLLTCVLMKISAVRS